MIFLNLFNSCHNYIKYILLFFHISNINFNFFTTVQKSPWRDIFHNIFIVHSKKSNLNQFSKNSTCLRKYPRKTRSPDFLLHLRKRKLILICANDQHHKFYKKFLRAISWKHLIENRNEKSHNRIVSHVNFISSLAK